MAEQTSHNSAHAIGYGGLSLVWLVLLALTALTVWVARHNVGIGHVWGSLVIAVVKGGLVIAFFMHMRYEGWLLRGLLFMVLAILAIFIGFTFFDILYR
jgi:cytochrome c oxidase subunit 4